MRPFAPELISDLPRARTPLALLGALGVLGAVAAVGQALALAWLITAVATGTGLEQPVLALVAVVCVRAVLSATAEPAAAWAGQRVAREVRSKVLRTWLRMPAHRRPSPDVALTRAADGITAIEPYVSRYLPALISAAIAPLLIVVVMAFVDIWSAAIVLATLPLLPLFAALIGRHTQDETRARERALTAMSGHFLDVVRGLPTLVSYGRAERQIQQVRRVGQRLRQATMKTLRTAFMSTVALELLATISVALVAVAVGLRLAYGWVPLFIGLAAILLAPEAYWPIRRVGQEFHNAADGQQALADLRSDLRTEPVSPEPISSEPATPEPATPDPSAATDWFGLDGVSFAHLDRPPALVEARLRCPAGPGLTVLSGPSGTGKSTVLDLIAGIREPQAGAVSAPRSVHYVTQRPLLVPGTVRSNLLLSAPEASDVEMMNALERVDLAAALRGRGGLDAQLGDDGFGLSAGQRARLALARALLTDADLICLDEPTAHIAPQSRDLIYDVIRALAGSVRTIVVTHDLDLAALADDVWELSGPQQQTARQVAARAESAPQVAAGTERVPVRDAGDREPGAQESGSQDSGSQDSGSQQPEPLQAPTSGTTIRWWHTDRARFALACLLGGLSAACGVALTATSGWLIVRASQQPVVLTLLVAVVGVRAFGIGRPVLRYAERVLSHDVVLSALTRARTATYARLIPLTPARLGQRRRADLLTAVVHDTDDVVSSRSRVTVPIVGAAIATGLAIAILLALLPAAGIAAMVASLAVIAVVALLVRSAGGSERGELRARAAIRAHLTEVIGSLDAYRAALGDRSASAADPIDALAGDQARRVVRSATVRGAGIAALWVIVAALTTVVASLSAAAYLAGEVGAPIAAMVALTPVALADVWLTLPAVAEHLARARQAQIRLHEVLDQEPAVAQASEGQHAPKPQEMQETQEPARAPASSSGATDSVSLALRDVSARWSPDSPLALQHFTLTVDPGDRVVLHGANGSGKSTALAVIARSLDPAGGRYELNGTSALDRRLDDARGHFALVDDEPHVFAGSVRANLLLANPGAGDPELTAALHQVGLSSFVTGVGGLDAVITGMSGGERTRLAVARALVSQRPVFLLDEPTAHLDRETATEVLEAINAQGARCTVVLVSHQQVQLDDSQLQHRIGHAHETADVGA